MRERILKTETEIGAITSYVDRKNDIIAKEIKELNKDFEEYKATNKESLDELKGINKDITKSINDNTVAIRELKAVLDLLKDQLGIKAMRTIKKG